MSYRYGASYLDPGLNTLVAPTVQYNFYGWGQNNYGQIGLGNITNYSSPKQIGSLTNWSKISSSGYNHSLAIKTDGTLWAWGQGAYGQLGLNNITGYSSPKQVGSLTNWSSVSSGNYFSMAIKTDGTLWGWGSNSFGQLGFNNTTSYSSPKQVGALTNWSKISCGTSSSGAIKTDGTLWAWGSNSFAGQLGLGNRTDYSSPKQVGALTTWASLFVGDYSMYAIKTDGTLWAWGANNNGQLGFNNTTSYSSPVQVGSLTNWLQVTSSFNLDNTGAVKTNGTLWMWGNNSVGQLGIGNTTYYSSPKQVGSLTTWTYISNPNGYYTLALQSNGTLWSWGYNSTGELGLGNTTNYSSPKQVGIFTTWKTISAGSGALAIG